MTAPGGTPITLIARFVALPGHREEASRLLAEYARHVQGSAGCEVFYPTTSDVHPLEFVVLERYRDAQAFEHHIAEPANALFNSALSPHVEGPSRLEMLNSIEE